VNWHQAEVYANVMTNPSMEGGTGDPWVPTGWTNGGTLGAVAAGGDANETTMVHTGLNSLKMAASTDALYGMRQTLPGANGTFYGVGAFLYNGIRLSGYNNSNLISQTSLAGAVQIVNTGGASWKHNAAVGRVLAVLTLFVRVIVPLGIVMMHMR
jgi:hypothetical protein